MSDSISSPWIRDYFIDVAEKYGAQLFDAPLSLGKKKVQLTDFLTYQENSYTWAWISDKDYRVSVRISKDAVDLYKGNHGRNIIDCRFSVVSISSYRPMFSPRPLGPNTTGNTRVSHLSLEVGHVRSVGVGGHLFGNPRDLEMDESMKEWVSGLRQDGGGGNVLKLRKQQELAQNQKASLLPSPPPFSLYAPVPQCQAIKPTEDVAKPKPEQPQDFKRAYTKRWRTIEANPWKFAFKPAAEERPNQTKPSPVPVELRSDTTSQLESRHYGALACPTTPLRTSSPSRSQPQGTPTNWSSSDRGSSAAPDKVTTFAFEEDGIERHEPEVLTSTPHLPSDAVSEGHGPADTTITSDICSLQPPTPAQRIKHSSPPRSTSPPRSSPELIAHSSPLPSQQLPCSFPPPPSSSLPPPSSFLPAPMKNIRRKVPHPGVLVAQSDPIKKGPILILVPNSDTSGAGSSQSYSQSQLSLQSQQLQRQLLSHPAVLPSSLAKDFEPPNTSTPREGQPDNVVRRTPTMFPGPVSPHCTVDEQEAALTGEKYSSEKPDTGKRERSDSTRPLVPSAPKIEVLEVGTSDTEEEADQLQSACTTTRTEVNFDAQTGNQDKDRRDTDAGHGVNHLSVDKAEVHFAPQSTPRRRLSNQPAASVVQHPSSNQDEADGASARRFPQPLEPSMSRSSMHSLFSDSLGDERTQSSHVLPVGRIEVKVQEKARPPNVPGYDAEAWKEPSFLARKKGKEKARSAEELDISKVKNGKKRRGSELEPPVPKRAKVATSEGRQMARGQTTIDRVQPQVIDASATGKLRSSDRPSTSPADTAERMAPPAAFQSSKPRLANLVVGFERIDLGKNVPVSMVDMAKDIKGTLLRTGRIRTIGEELEKDGGVYLMQ